jgi:hypothetical protein
MYSENLKKRHNLEDRHIYGGMWKCELESDGLGQGPVADSSKYGNKLTIEGL